jgi:hypothetical protein
MVQWARDEGQYFSISRSGALKPISYARSPIKLTTELLGPYRSPEFSCTSALRGRYFELRISSHPRTRVGQNWPTPYSTVLSPSGPLQGPEAHSQRTWHKTCPATDRLTPTRSLRLEAMCNYVTHEYAGCGHKVTEKAECATSRAGQACGIRNNKTVKHADKCDDCDG